MRAIPWTRRAAVTAAVAGGLLLGSTAGAAAFTQPPDEPPTSGTVTPATADSEQAGTDGAQFLSGAVIEVAEDVDGDVYAAGQRVTVTGDVTGDVIAAGQIITIAGDVDGNVRLAAQDVSISGDVSRSATVFSESMNLTEEGSLGGDLVGAANNITVSGDIGRNVLTSVERLTIGGSVGGDVTYSSSREADVDEGSVGGSTERVATAPVTEKDTSPGAIALAWLLGLLYALVALSLITLLAGLLMPRRLTQVTDQLMRSPWKALLVGFIASIAVPVVLVILLITIIGAPLGLAGMLIWLLLTLATFVYGSFFIGRLVYRRQERPVLTAVIGGLILIVALQIPWLNIAVWLAMVLFGLGAQLLDFYDKWPRRVHREAHAEPPAEQKVSDRSEEPEGLR